jgi:hypothetical protein
MVHSKEGRTDVKEKDQTYVIHTKGKNPNIYHMCKESEERNERKIPMTLTADNKNTYT